MTGDGESVPGSIVSMICRASTTLSSVACKDRSFAFPLPRRFVA